jgi:hypothetical protein
MGMHSSFMIARCGWPDLRSAIEADCGPLSDAGPVLQAHAGGDDVNALLKGPPEGGARYTYTADRFPAQGQLGRQISEHSWTRRRPDADDWQERITVVRREDGNFDTRAWT